MRGPGFESRLGQHFFFHVQKLANFSYCAAAHCRFLLGKVMRKRQFVIKELMRIEFFLQLRETKQSSNCLWPWVKPYLHQKVSCLALCIYISKLGLLLQTQFNFQTQTEISLQIKVIKTTMILTIFVHFLRVLSSSIELFLVTLSAFSTLLKIQFLSKK